MNLRTKRQLFPLSAPRWQTLAWWPVHVFAVSVDAYATTYLAVLTPRGRS